MTHMGPQFTQLPMFIRSGDVVEGKIASAEANPRASESHAQSTTSLWRRKRRDNDERPGFKASVAKEGVRDPVWIDHDQIKPGSNLVEGHHRVVASNDTRGPDSLVAVHHFDSGASFMVGAPRKNPKMLQGFVPPKGRA